MDIMGDSERIEYAALVNIDQVTTFRGDTEYMLTIEGNSEEAASRLAKKLSGPDTTPKRLGERDLGGNSSFGFSSKRWSSPYNPEGPKKNWRTPPADPTLN